MYLLKSLPNWYREEWDISLLEFGLVWKPMDSLYPVVVTHPVNKVFKDQATTVQDKQVLTKSVLQCSTQSHVCHRKRHLISHTWFLGIVLRMFVPFDVLVGLSATPRLHDTRAD